MRHTIASLGRALAFSLGVLSVLATPASSQRQWLSTDGSPAGTPAEVKYDNAASDAQSSFFDVFIHGFWIDPLVGPDEMTYSTIDVPGLSERIMQVGAPQLPAIRLDLAVGTEAREVRTVLSFFDVFFLIPRVAPEFVPGMDQTGEDPPPRDPQFTRDDAIYRFQSPWPPTDGSMVDTVKAMLGSVRGTQVVLFPMHWNPSNGQLRVWRQARIQFVHSGAPRTSPPITRERGKLAGVSFANWPGASSLYPINTLLFDGDFLFVYPPGYREELLPLINQKWARGFFVTEREVPLTGNTCASIEAIIDAWYAAAPPHRDKYCLLVGDVDVIPTCTSPALGGDYPSGVATDDIYASTNGVDLNEEIYLGRLSVDSEADLASQVTKILAYEDTPLLFGNYDEVLLVAHREDAPGKYVGAHESVRTAAYTVPPVFTTLYGHNAGVDNADVSAEINAKLGLVAYRGHGSSTAWTGWNTLGESFDTGDVGALANAPLAPVVWSFACTNQRLSSEDCIGETWMEQVGNGAVSHYGATVASYTSQNHELDRRMFRAVYFWGLTTQSHAIKYAESLMASVVGPENAWMYLLLGDPDMQIRRRPPVNWVVLAPARVPICSNPPCMLRVKVLTPGGQPLPEMQVSAWKPSSGEAGPGALQGEEVFDNRYTGSDGGADVPASPTTTGWIVYSIQDDQGNAVLDSIEVTNVTDVPVGVAEEQVFRALPSVTSGATFLSFGRILTTPTTIAIHDVSGRLVRSIGVGAGLGGTTWDGRITDGTPARSGLYFARFSDSTTRAIARIIVAR